MFILYGLLLSGILSRRDPIQIAILQMLGL